MEVLIAQIIALLGMVAVVVLMIIYNFKEFKYRKKIELLEHLIDKGYEYENIDINNI